MRQSAVANLRYDVVVQRGLVCQSVGWRIGVYSTPLLIYPCRHEHESRA